MVATTPSRRIVLMVRELHDLGFERMRICPRLSNSGVHWQCWLTASENVLQSHGGDISPLLVMESMRAIMNEDSEPLRAAFYGSVHESRYFGWQDALNDGPRELAAKFVARFPAIISEAEGLDPEYVTWYRQMIEASAPNGLPSTYTSAADYAEQLVDVLALLGESENDSVHLPPPGGLVLERTPKPRTSLWGRFRKRLGLIQLM